MNWVYRLQQEVLFLKKERALLTAAVALFLLTSISVALGIDYVRAERQEIAELREVSSEEQRYQQAQVSSYGDAAYYTFYATWNSPSALAFAAIGQRDLSPTMMRIRALALEGQIYETDSINPELALSGRFDFAFVTAYLLPLFVLFAFYNLFASERESGRFNLLLVSATSVWTLWLPRVLLRVGVLFLAIAVPLWAGMVIEQTELSLAVVASSMLLLQLLIWTVVFVAIASLGALKSDAIAALGIGIWALLSLLVPVLSKVAIEQAVPGIQGSQVALVQREAVNDAWDLPKSTTMERFFASHPEWSDTVPVTEPFHWKWYYAFHQVGDETAAPLSEQYRQTMLERDRLTARVAWLSPTVAIQRQFENLAGTGLQASLAFEDQIRAYHELIRKTYYPVLFDDPVFSQATLRGLAIPEFDAFQ